MKPDPQSVPSVVSVMVVHEPGGWFDETLQALAGQDYPNLRTLFLLTPASEDEIATTTARIRAVLPSAFVRPVAANVGFGAAVDEVLRLVEGDNGFFLVCHDDIAPASDAVRTLVTELFRSNAGIVGPKLTDWDHPRTLQHVGLGLDRFGEVDPVVEPGEVDQEQHDAVRDVFVLPSACLLVRADLFRSLGGFDPAISFHGEDIDLCWRAHLTGARVIVAPDARVRHREQLTERRPDLNHRTLQARHRMRTVATLTGGSRLFVRSLQLVLLTVVELVVGLFTGRFGEALASLRALVGLVPRTGSIVARRRAIRAQRAVPEREVLGLQDRGSSRLTSYLRGKDTTTYVGADSTIRRWRETSFGPVLAWFLVLLAVVIGSRTFIRDGVPPVGEFLAFPDSPSDLWSRYGSSWDPRSFGATAAVPTGWAVLAVASVLALFRMGLFLTLAVVGSFVLGAFGAWRLATVFPVNRARIAGMIVYVGTPLVPGVMSVGDWSALAWYAALPWLVHLLRRAAGIATADPSAADADLTDGIVDLALRQRLRWLATLTITLAVTVALVPVVIVLWAAVGLVLAVATLIAGGSWRTAAWLGGCTAISVASAAALNLPWSLEWSWAGMVGVPPAGSSGRGLAEVATLAPDTDRLAVLAIALYLPLLAAVAITRAWRLTWSVRAAALVLGFGALAVFADRGSLGFTAPSSSLLSVPIALGLALGAAAMAGGFGTDVLGRGFGWRQPVAVLANLAIVVGLVPAVLSIGNGSWHTPRTPLSRLLATQLGEDVAVGDFRVLYVGDPRVLPVPAREYRPGIGYAVTDAGALDFTDRFVTPDTAADVAVERALDLIAVGSTLRAGRLLAPLGIRYIVIPRVDGARSTVADPLPVPEGLVGALQNQLDIGTVYGPPSLEIFVNQAWFPVGAQLTGATAEASRAGGEQTLVRADLTAAVPSMIGFDGSGGAANEVAPGVVHLAVPFDERFVLDVDGTAVEPRPGFGITTAFDIEQGGVGIVRHRADGGRAWWLTYQALAWLLVAVVAIGARSPFARRRMVEVHDETLIELGDDPTLSGGIVGEVLGRPAWDDEDEDDEDAEDEDDEDRLLLAGLDREPDEVAHADLGARPDAVLGFGSRPAIDDRPARPVPSRTVPTPPSRAPRPTADGADDDDEVDLAALVAEVDRAGHDDGGAGDEHPGRGEDERP